MKTKTRLEINVHLTNWHIIPVISKKDYSKSELAEVGFKVDKLFCWNFSILFLTIFFRKEG
jgi:hypothetical protein